ncbi:hypothetical protein C2S53_000065 [Perilla frutescens var. hirtella]|uniref:Uncharacterized protein n=1 Tax=Perilla frutescens var. hirtella TaxID=608512 RepID=A0AAD4IV63_PERFH|nr:hypothetical protein C2S53_000065 [Perilla frutescens var. hirtella]
MLTPPLHPSVSIPFEWEEAPGKPRLSADEGTKSGRGASRCLELPPRLSHEGEEVTIMPLGGGRSMSLACTFSFAKKRRRWRFKLGEEEEMGAGGGSVDFSQSLGDIFKREKKAKMRGITRVRSFFDFSTINFNSNL